MEKYEICLLSYSFLIFVIYVAFIWIKFGILGAISDSYYELTKASQPMFTFFIWSVSMPIIIVGVPETPLMFFAGAFLSFVGAAPAFRNKEKIVDNVSVSIKTMEGKVHAIGAIAGIGFGVLAMLLVFKTYLLVLALVGFSVYIKASKTKNSIWWIEIVSFLTIYLSLVIYKILI